MHDLSNGRQGEPPNIPKRNFHFAYHDFFKYYVDIPQCWISNSTLAIATWSHDFNEFNVADFWVFAWARSAVTSHFTMTKLRREGGKKQITFSNQEIWEVFTKHLGWPLCLDMERNNASGIIIRDFMPKYFILITSCFNESIPGTPENQVINCKTWSSKCVHRCITTSPNSGSCFWNIKRISCLKVPGG